MTTPVAARFSDEDIRRVDRLVEAGVGRNRSDVIRLAVNHLDEIVRRAAIGREIADSFMAHPQSEDDDVLATANALAMTLTEPW